MTKRVGCSKGTPRAVPFFNYMSIQMRINIRDIWSLTAVLVMAGAHLLSTAQYTGEVRRLQKENDQLQELAQLLAKDSTDVYALVKAITHTDRSALYSRLTTINETMKFLVQDPEAKAALEQHFKDRGFPYSDPEEFLKNINEMREGLDATYQRIQEKLDARQPK